MIDLAVSQGLARCLSACVLVLVAEVCHPSTAIAAPPPATETKLADYFGFQPLEIYKLERRIGNLLIRDLDGDKTGDILVANNARSRIDLLLSSKKVAEAEARPFRKEANELEYDRRMRLASLPVNKEVVSVGTGDFNADDKPDIVYYGTPAEVEILYNEGLGRFGNAKRINSGEALESPHALAVGDIDRNGRDDIVLLAENELIFVYQTPQGTLSEPERVPHTAGNPRLVKLIDLDGDHTLDLVILDGGNDHPIHVRFGSKEKTLGPEQRFQVEAPRAIAFGQMNGKDGMEILTIEGQSGRGKVFSLDESDDDGKNRWGRLVFFGLPQGSDRGRSFAVGDVDGDKRKDVVVTDPANAQFWLYRQIGRTGLSSGQSFPGLLGARVVRLADLDGDGADELYVLSDQEKQIGRSRFQNGRITFPTALPIKGEPQALEVAKLDGSNGPALLYVSRTKPGGDTYELRALRRTPSGGFAEVSFQRSDSLPLTGLQGTPSELRAVDLNRDGRTDLLLFGSYSSPMLLLGQAEGPMFKPLGGNLGPLAGISPQGLSLMDLDGPAVLVAQNTFARRIHLDAQGEWSKDQFNAGRGSAQIQGAAVLDADGDGKPDIVMLDRSTKSLLFLSLKDGVFRPSGSVSLGTLSFEGTRVADFDGDGRDDLLVAGSDRFAILQTGRKRQHLKVIGTYESKRNEARFTDLATAELNADGVPDVVFTDVAEQSLEIGSFVGEENLLHAITFKLFERRVFRGAGDMIEPREIASGDVDGDGRDDLVLVAHDRVLILRQDPGTPERNPSQAAASGAPANGP